LNRYSEKSREYKKVDFERIREELTLCREIIREKDSIDDCITPVDFAEKIKEYGGKWDGEVYSLKAGNTEIRLNEILLGLVEEVNEKLGEYRDCEICPVQITPGLVADALKYLAIGVYAYKYSKEKEYNY